MRNGQPFWEVGKLRVAALDWNLGALAAVEFLSIWI